MPADSNQSDATDKTPPPQLGPTSRSAWVTAVMVTVAGLYVGRELLVPLVVGVFLNLLLAPLVRSLRRHLRVPSAIGAVVVLALFCFVVGFTIYQLAGPTRSWAQQLPRRWSEVQSTLRTVKKPFEDIQKVGREVEKVAELEDGVPARRKKNREVEIIDGQTPLERVVSRGGAFALTTLFVILFVFLTLATSESFLKSIVRALPRLEEQKTAVTVVRAIESKVSRYLVTITFINLGLGVAVGVSTWAFGLPNPALWGAMACIFNFVPYAGAIAGICVVAMASLLSFDTVSGFLAPPMVYMGLTALEGYVLTPMALGRSLSLEPVVVFVSVFFWGWMWGIAGAFLAVPIVIVAKVVCDNIDSLMWIGHLLGPSVVENGRGRRGEASAG